MTTVSTCHLCNGPMHFAPIPNKPEEPSYYCYSCGERYVQGPVSAGQELRVVNFANEAVVVYRVDFGGRRTKVATLNPAEFVELARLLNMPTELPRPTVSGVDRGRNVEYGPGFGSGQ